MEELLLLPSHAQLREPAYTPLHEANLSLVPHGRRLTEVIGGTCSATTSVRLHLHSHYGRLSTPVKGLYALLTPVLKEASPRPLRSTINSYSISRLKENYVFNLLASLY